MSLVRPEIASVSEDLSDPARTEIEFTTITDASSFERLGAEWDELVRAMPRPSPYLLHGWLCEWWRHYGGGRRLCVQAAHRGGKLVAALPLCVSERRRARTLEFLGGGTSALADLLLADGEDESAARPLAERAARSGQDFADLFGLTGGSRLAAALGSSGLRLVPRVEAPVLDLSEGWDIYFGVQSIDERGHVIEVHTVFVHSRRVREVAVQGAAHLLRGQVGKHGSGALEVTSLLEHADDHADGRPRAPHNRVASSYPRPLLDEWMLRNTHILPSLAILIVASWPAKPDRCALVLVNSVAGADIQCAARPNATHGPGWHAG